MGIKGCLNNAQYHSRLVKNGLFSSCFVMRVHLHYPSEF